ncbi:hypothetical protein GCM10011367_09090 [Marinicauda pacifica]|uniref:Paraquat-inducible protein A n=2 Tax=Marinicauda pacifica TaxID=1133559 RepID=A0A4S2HER1_9PROT|nr:hypothetical protein E5162_04610 [Marinicauda pacifica]GGE36860.1 hypothetical protein GCM10011367_09090 [Marinicauda pacifica]
MGEDRAAGLGHNRSMTRSLASPSPDLHGAGGALGRAFLFLGIMLLPLGLTLPLMETARLVVLRATYSVLETIQVLWATEEFALALILGVFCVAIPVAKACLLTWLHLSSRAFGRRALRLVDILGKWSLSEVLIVAAMIVLWSSDGFSSAASLPGLWIFAASTVLLMLAAGQITRDARRHLGAEAPPASREGV